MNFASNPNSEQGIDDNNSNGNSVSSCCYAVKKCSLLQAPAIFFTIDDCEWLLGQEKEYNDVEYKLFESLQEAALYLFPVLSGNTSTLLLFNNASNGPQLVENNRINDDVSINKDHSVRKKKRNASVAELDHDNNDGRIQERKNRKVADIDDANKNWDSYIEQLRLFYEKNGHSNVQKHDNPKLYKWMTIVRNEYKDMQHHHDEKQQSSSSSSSLLTNVRIEQLNEFHFDFSLPKKIIKSPTTKGSYKTFWIDHWDNMIQLLKQFKETFGTCDVPNTSNDPEGFTGLGMWVGAVRQQIRLYNTDPTLVPFLNDTKIQEIMNIGFCLEPTRGKKRFFPDASILQGNVKKPAPTLRNGDPNWQTNWDQMVDMLTKYKQIHGTVNLPQDTNDDPEGFPGLRWWLVTACYYMRQFNADPTRVPFLTKEKVEHLTKDLGLILYAKVGRRTTKDSTATNNNTNENWHNMYNELVKFKQEHGHTRIPKSMKALNIWVNKMKTEYEKTMNGRDSTILTSERMIKMVELGFRFTRNKVLTFDDRAKQWKQYKDTHNGEEPKRDNPDGIGKWVIDIRYKYKQRQNGEATTLTQKQIDTLNNWGFKWESDYKPQVNRRPTQTWEQSFQMLCAYKEKYGHVMVPRKHKTLGGWVHGQRGGYTKFLAGEKSHLSTQKIKKLTDIGFAFRTGSGAHTYTNSSSSSTKQRRSSTINSNKPTDPKRTTGNNDETKRTDDSVARAVASAASIPATATNNEQHHGLNDHASEAVVVAVRNKEDDEEILDHDHDNSLIFVDSAHGVEHAATVALNDTTTITIPSLIDNNDDTIHIEEL